MDRLIISVVIALLVGTMSGTVSVVNEEAART